MSRVRNKPATTRYRAKTQAAVVQMEAAEEEVNLQHKPLLACAGRLHDEVFPLKNELLQHADCSFPLIEGYSRKRHMRRGRA